MQPEHDDMYCPHFLDKLTPPKQQDVYRVIDDGTCILTTLDPRKAIVALSGLIDKHDVTACWIDTEALK